MEAWTTVLNICAGPADPIRHAAASTRTPHGFAILVDWFPQYVPSDVPHLQRWRLRSECAQESLLRRIGAGARLRFLLPIVHQVQRTSKFSHVVKPIASNISTHTKNSSIEYGGQSSSVGYHLPLHVHEIGRKSITRRISGGSAVSGFIFNNNSLPIFKYLKSRK